MKNLIYLYDKSIADDLRKSFNPENMPDPYVKVVDVDSFMSIGAQVKDDRLTFPIVGLNRPDNYSIDTDRTNFTLIHKGVTVAVDDKENEFYNEKVIPIKQSYDIHVLTTNQADMDEMIREIIFKYTNMYFLTITLPYEVKRKIRFGICIDGEIERTSGYSQYAESGTLYESIIPVRTEGMVIVSYTPVRIRRTEFVTEIENPKY